MMQEAKNNIYIGTTAFLVRFIYNFKYNGKLYQINNRVNNIV